MLRRSLHGALQVLSSIHVTHQTRLALPTPFVCAQPPHVAWRGASSPVAPARRPWAATRAASAQPMEALADSEPAVPAAIAPSAAASPISIAAAPSPDLGAAAPPPGAPQPAGVRRTFYKRKLPSPPATEFSSPEGRAIFGEALANGSMTGFFRLVEQYSTQDEPAFCGLASIAMVLNALAIDPRRPWKGSWRWFHEKLLDCCMPLDKVAAEGVTLSQAACLAKCNGARVVLARSGSFTLEDFRAQIADVCSSGDEHIVVSYSRRTLSQTGDGHFSPVGGYHAGRDLVLILDTARFKYPPHWVPLSLLYEAMAPHDKSTGQPRGFLRLSARALPDSVLFTLDIDDQTVQGAAATPQAATTAAAPAAATLPAGSLGAPMQQAVVAGSRAAAGANGASVSGADGEAVGSASWREAEVFIRDVAPALVQQAAAGGRSAAEAVRAVVCAAPLAAVRSFVAVRFSARQLCSKERCVPHHARAQVLQELRAMPLYQLLAPELAERVALNPPGDPAHGSSSSSSAAGAGGASNGSNANGGCSTSVDSSGCSTSVDSSSCSNGVSAYESAAVAADLLAERLCMLLLLQEPGAWGAPPEAWADAGAAGDWGALMDASAVSIVEAEVLYLREQLRNIGRVLATNGSQSSCRSSDCANALDCQTKGDCSAAAAATAAGAQVGGACSGASLGAPPDLDTWEACTSERIKACCSR